MPIRLSKEEVVKKYLLDDGSELIVVARQFNGSQARSYDTRVNTGMSVPDVGTVQLHPPSWLYRAGVAAALSLKECSLADSETGKKILTSSANDVDGFLNVWFDPALQQTALTIPDTGKEFSYCDLVTDAVYEANPQINPFLDAERPPSS